MSSMYNLHIDNEELSNMLSALKPLGTYQVPLGYFDNLSNEVLSKIQSENIELGKKEPLFNAPKGYFQTLPENILKKIKQQQNVQNNIQTELEEITPLLNKIDKQPVFYLPKNYFETLTVTNALPKQAKVLQLFKNLKIKHFAAAAIISACLFTGVKIYTAHNASKADFESRLAKTSEDEISKYLDNPNNVEFAFTQMHTEDSMEGNFLQENTDKELKEYLQEQPETTEKGKDDI